MDFLNTCPQCSVWPVLIVEMCTCWRSSKTCLRADKNSHLSLSLWKYSRGYSHYGRDDVLLIVSQQAAPHASDISFLNHLLSQTRSVIHVRLGISLCRTSQWCVPACYRTDSLSSSELKHAAWETGIMPKLISTDVREILQHLRAA